MLRHFCFRLRLLHNMYREYPRGLAMAMAMAGEWGLTDGNQGLASLSTTCGASCLMNTQIW